jgi:hypothetical protein
MPEEHIVFRPVSGTFTNKGNSVRVTEVRGPEGFRALAFQCHLNEDNDGSPQAYVAPGSGLPHLDGLGSATNHPSWLFNNNKFLWKGVLAKTPGDASKLGLTIDPNPDLEDAEGKFPVLQSGPKGVVKDRYVSTTSALANPKLREWDQNRYLDPVTFSYGALSDAVKGQRVALGDFALVIRPATAGSSGLFFADSAGEGSTAVGECSRKVVRKLSPSGFNEDFVNFLVFPNSGNGAPGPASEGFIKDKITAQISKLAKAKNAAHLALFFALNANPETVRLVLMPRFLESDRQLAIAQLNIYVSGPEFQNTMQALDEWGWSNEGEIPIDL